MTSLRCICLLFFLCRFFFGAAQNIDSVIHKGNFPNGDLSSSNLSIVLKKRNETDSLRQALSSEIDNLRTKVSDPLDLQRKSDSLRAFYNKAIGMRLSMLSEKGMSLSNEEKNFLTQSGLPDLSLNLPTPSGFDLPNTTLPDVQLPVASLPLTLVNTDVGLSDLKKVSMPVIPGIEQSGKTERLIGHAGELGGKAGKFVKGAKEMKEEGIARSENVDQLAEEGIKNFDAVEAFQKELNGAEQLKRLQLMELQKISNSQQLRDVAASKQATEKILSNEELIKKQMQKMSKHKKKFDNLPDMRYIPKVKPNAMKGKPLKERAVPGMLFQVLKEGDMVSWFVAPEILYKFSGTFSGGAAGMYRFQYSSSPKMIWGDPVYGYKLIAQAKAYKGFYLRTEWENTSIMIPIIQSRDIRSRDWKSNWLTGVGRVQKISNRFNGYFWGFYNLSRDPQDIFKSRVIIKTGLQFNLVNEHKKVQKHISDKIERLSGTQK